MTSIEMEQSDTSKQAVIKAVLLFLAAFALYFLTHSPALDEIDAVQFAMGVRSFDLWHHQPHPPGYPLFIFLSWLMTKIFHTGTESSLYFISAFGGGLFVASWFLIIRAQFSEKLAWWVAISLLITPVVWMTATKAVTDMLAAGLLSAELLAAIYFLEQKKRGLIICAALLGAAAAGTRPQLFPVVAVILGIPLKKSSSNPKTWCFAYAALAASCLIWLLPMWYTQWQLRPDEPFWRVYPELVYGQWRWRLNRPSIYIGAGDWSPHYLGKRFASHILGWFSKGFGFIQSPRVLVAGIVLTMFAAIAYLWFGCDTLDRRFWKFHTPWLIVHIAIIFVSLSGDQRYYLVVFPPLLVIMLRGLLRLPKPWSLSAVCVPALLLYIVLPLAIENHREEAPPVRLVRYLEKLYPPANREDVLLILPTTRRSAQWYAPQFKILDHLPTSEQDEETVRNAKTVYTEDASFNRKNYYFIELAEFRRSMLIYPQHHRVRLYLVERRPSA
jgi:4-amino-4-deoxy-L-arabinose transferase-like glycosyltransferase